MPTITPQELKQKIDAGEQLLVLDVREPFEYDDWHIPDSINIPVSNFMHHPLPQIPKDKEIVAVCAHGMRSEAARRILAAVGYNVSSMQGGMVEWNGIYDIIEINENVIQVRRIGKGCLSYIIKSGNEAIVIDPTIDIDIYIEAAEKANTRIISVIDTHAHADHASGGRMFAAKGITYCAPQEVGRAQHVKDGDVIRFGSSSISAITAPGHTPGSLCYRFGKFIFTGDTLFVDGVGRPDLGQDSGKAAPILYDTVQKLLTLSDDTTVLPAHAEIEKIQPQVPIKETMDEIRQLDALKKSRDEFVRWMAAFNRPAPNNFEIIKEYNTGLIRIDDISEFRELEAGANRCAVK